MNRAQLFVIVQFILFVAFAAALLLSPMANTPLTLIVGSLMAIIGVGIGFAAILQFRIAAGTFPNAVPIPTTGAKLVEAGFYGIVRHPIYTGVMIAAVGAAIAHGAIIAALIALAFIPFFAVKSRYEERQLLSVFPDYANYMERTGRFLPGL
ncbi:MAG: isoprenylcysteine carboxylmethyltransferase family protein [Chloroflexota bacterium]|nr:isoprenylcysteine carboxylmethyltransferase family protein [Chloroflexota bacterium]